MDVNILRDIGYSCVARDAEAPCLNTISVYIATGDSKSFAFLDLCSDHWPIVRPLLMRALLEAEI